MKTLNQGDRVSHKEYGKGTVRKVDGNSIGVEFDKRNRDFHSLGGKAKAEHGYWVNIYELTDILPTTTKIIIETDGVTTTAKLIEDGKKVRESKAVKLDSDEHDMEVASQLVLERLFQSETKVVKTSTYTVGDTVKIREDLSSVRDTKGAGVMPSMHRYAGKEAKIISIYGLYGEKFYINIDDGDWVWSTDMIEGKVVPVETVTTKIVKQSSYAVGDKVKMLDKPTSSCAGCSMFDLEHKGKIVTITKVEPDERRQYTTDVVGGCRVYLEDIEGKVVETRKRGR